MGLFGSGVDVFEVASFVVLNKDTKRAKTVINPQTGEKDFLRVILPKEAVDGTGQLLPMFSSLISRGEVQARVPERPATKVRQEVAVKPVKVIEKYEGEHLHLGPHRND